LTETGLDPMYLELELTESIMQDSDEAIQLLCQLQSMGVQIAIDDFGTGYSSLNHLKRYPINKLKVDQSFVRDIGHDPHDRAIVKAIIALAQSLNMRAVAEGVETEAQMTYLRSLKCDEAQGYLLGRPMSAQAASKLLADQGPSRDSCHSSRSISSLSVSAFFCAFASCRRANGDGGDGCSTAIPRWAPSGLTSVRKVAYGRRRLRWVT
jgi:predicted signal transduction protein with EAL and GGDEF domain